MNSFKAYFKKEILESVRVYRYIIITAGILFFAVSGPIMLKILPKILESELQANLAALMKTSVKIGLQGYIKDLYQIGSMFIVFTLCSSLSEEIHTNKLVFPYSKGGNPIGLVLAKLAHYSITIFIITMLGFAVNYYYSNLLFEGDAVDFLYLLQSGALMSLYYIFLAILTIFLSSLFKKGLTAGIIVLAISYFAVFLNNLKAVKDLIPYNLISLAGVFGKTAPLKTITSVIILCAFFTILTIIRMSKVEVA